MSYGLRIRFEFRDDQDRYYAANLYQRDYTGIADIRELTGSPVVIEYGDDGAEDLPTMLGAMATVNFYADTPDNWSELYTSDRRKFRLDIRQDAAVSGQLVFTGWVMPQEFSERLAWQSELSIKAFCGLGELKDVSFTDGNGDMYSGRKSYLQIITDILSKLDLGINIYTTSDWMDTSMSPGDPLSSTYVGSEIYKDLTCRDVLLQLLPESRIMQRNGAWYIERYSCLNKPLNTRYGYDYLGLALTPSTTQVSLRAEINQAEIWTEGTPDLLRWPAYEKVVINQDFGKKESFVVNYEIDSASGWIPSADIVTREWTAEDKTNTYIQGICGAFDEPSGLYQTIPIKRFTAGSKIKFSAKVAPIGWKRYDTVAPVAPLVPVNVPIEITVKLLNSAGEPIAWLSKTGWSKIATVIREGYDSTVSGTLNWNEITIDTAEPTSLFEGEDFFIFIMLGKTAWVDLWNGSQGQDETYHGVAFSDVIFTEQIDSPNSQEITAVNNTKYLTIKSGIKSMQGTAPSGANVPLVWAGGLSTDQAGNTRAYRWKLEGESTEYSYCELQARMILSRRRKPLVVMQADLIGGSVENIYTELNQGSTDFVFAGGSWEIKTRCISGTWSELLPVDLTACSVTISRKASSAQGSVRITNRNIVSGDTSSPLFSEINGGLESNRVLTDYINSIIKANPDSRTYLISGAIMYDTGFTYRSTQLVYKINGVSYQISPQEITTEPAEATLGRIDIFYVDSSSVIGYRKGIPGANPVKPTVAFGELEITQVYVAGGQDVPDFAIDTVYDENIEWESAAINDTNISVDFESTNQPLSGSKCISVGIAVPNTAQASPTHKVGDQYQGGIIFYLNPGGKSGYIAATLPSSEGVNYSESHTTGANFSAVGSGESNTELLMSKDISREYAAMYAYNYEKDGYTDWFLPSATELWELASHRTLFPGLVGTFWSSTEASGTYDWKKALCVEFSGGVCYTRDKTNSYKVVPIRFFNDQTAPVNVPVEVVSPGQTALTFTNTQEIDVTNGIVSFYLRSSLPWLQGTSLVVSLYNGSILSGKMVISKNTQMHSYNDADPQWQLVAVPAVLFNLSTVKINGLTISPSNSWPNNIVLGIDKIQIQHDSSQAPKVVIQGVYGGSDKSLRLTTDPTGKVIQIEEVDIAMTDYRFQEAFDDTLTLFTTLKPFIAGTTEIIRNGLRQSVGDNEDYTEVDGKILLNYAPASYEKFIISYRTKK